MDLHGLTQSFPTLRSSDLGNAVRPDRERHLGARIIGEHDRRASADDGIIGGVAREMEGVTTLFEATEQGNVGASDDGYVFLATLGADRKSTRLNSSH